LLRGNALQRIVLLTLLFVTANNGAAQSIDPDSPPPATEPSASAKEASPARRPVSTSVKNSPAMGGSTIMAKGQVKGVVEGRIRFDSSMFRNIAAGQIFIVESKTSGERAARVEVLQVSKNKKLSSAKVLKLESGLEVKDLLGLMIYREKDFKALYSEVQLSTLIAPEPLLGRNNSLNFHLNLQSVTPPAPNIMTGVALNQSVTSLGPTVEFFIPSKDPLSAANRLGLFVQYLQSIPITIVGKVNGTDETQSLKLNTTDTKAALIFKMRASRDSLSHFWISAGYQIVESRLKLETNVNVGNTGLEFKQTGPEFSFGVDGSPLPFLYLGLDLNAGLPQRYTSIDRSSAVARSGNWNQIKAGVYGELRYPVGRGKSNVLSLQMKGGATVDQYETKKNSQTVKENILNPLFAVRLGLHAG
jgi:hypothetical protein